MMLFHYINIYMSIYNSSYSGVYTNMNLKIESFIKRELILGLEQNKKTPETVVHINYAIINIYIYQTNTFLKRIRV